jgi:rfaE bifunctional protein kinase chain/domain
MEGSYIGGDSGKTVIRAGNVFRVRKEWGEEQWIVNKEYCGKKLILRKNHRCSMHRHEEKDEVFYVQSGKVAMELNGKTTTLYPGDFVHVAAGKQHRFTGLEDSEIIEFSTNHREDDSFRTELSGHVEQERFDRQRGVIRRFSKASVLVLGDVMLDTYVAGDVTRISPEAPIPVVLQRSRRHVPGGAANAGANIASLGGRATVVGVVGSDSAGKELAGLLNKLGVRSALVQDAKRVTTEKQRVTGNSGHQLVRIDHEDVHALPSAVERKLLQALKRELRKHDVLLLSDYAKGVFSPALLKSCIAAARKARVPVILDPKPHGPDYVSSIRGVVLVTPNRAEANVLAGGGSKSIRTVAHAIARRIAAPVLCTLGPDGMMLVSPKNEILGFPALASGVVDVSGAGDTVASTVALSLAAGALLHDAVDIANRAASVVVEKAGTATLTSAELLRVL